MTAPQACGAEVTIGGATYACTRRRRHRDEPMDPMAEFHQCEGTDHPEDGNTYRMTWTSPELVPTGREIR